ncbi:N-6 DNA methylase [Erysipelatoclostridium sp. An173]|uniref:N-6 DNA methylase n=1 Tax=Erysipelatoclostridium sp. An173 TaxID=1965571 RepID=UPI001302D5D5|nr:N-6 DNA methylase [Erysipelatoclostridium sp. An173]
MKNINLLELKKIDTTKVACTLLDALIGLTDVMHIHLKSIACAYVINKMQTTMQYSNMEEFIEKADLSNDQKEIISQNAFDCWDIIVSNLSKFTSFELLAFILFNNPLLGGKNGSMSTPSELLNLALSILNIKDTDEVLELCSGKGNFIVEATTNGCISNYTGIELNITEIMIAKLRASIIKENYNYILHDALDYRLDKKADKIFANYPFMMRSPAINSYKKQLEKTTNLPKDIIRRASSDWLFNLSIMDQLKKDGKAVVLMTYGSTWNNTDEKIRQYFIESGYIESVVSLAPRLFEEMSIPVSLVVLSHNNKSVRLVDAKNLFKSERKKNILTQENINDILGMLDKDSELSTTKTIKELSENEFVLNASRYFEVLPTIENGVAFGTVIKNITRGSQLRASDLDEYKSSIPTNFKYLMLSNINDGVIALDNEDQYLKEIPEKLEKYCIKNNMIVLSKTGMPAFKSAVAQIDDKTKVVANGNLFVIELDENKINPFFIQAFFASNVGEMSLKSIYTGAAIPTITLDKLKKMIIPLPTLKEQEHIAQKYAAAMDELILLNRKVVKTKNRMKHIFEEEE